MKILVTGAPGSGKTSLVKCALSLGNRSFIDADEYPQLCEWRSFSEGKFISKVDLNDLKKEDQWYKENGWFWDEEVMRNIISSDQDIILCGSSENVTDFYSDFDKVFILVKTEEQLLSNLNNPSRTNPFARTTKQRVGFMRWQEHLINKTKLVNDKSRVYLLGGNNISKIYREVEELTRSLSS